MIAALLTLPLRATVRGFTAAVQTEPIPTLLFGAPDPDMATYSPIPSPPPFRHAGDCGCIGPCSPGGVR